MEVVKKIPQRFLSANEGLCPFNPHQPFFEGLDPKIYVFCAKILYKKSFQIFCGKKEDFLKNVGII